MYFFGEIDPNSIKNILENQNVREALKDIKQEIFSGNTPVTDNKFVILGFAIALSTYISTVSREHTRSIGRAIKNNRFSRAEEKTWDLIALIVGDILFLWLLIIVPILWNIFHWFLTLEPTSLYFGFMRWWLFLGIFFGSLYMFLLHMIQAISEFRFIYKLMKDKGYIP